MRYRVTKAIDFCYGHRLVGYSGQCRHLHGHNGLLEVDAASDAVNELDMVKDFVDMRKLVKGWVDANIDHRMVLSRNDPAVPALTELGEPLYLIDDNSTAENIAKHIYR